MISRRIISPHPYSRSTEFRMRPLLILLQLAFIASASSAGDARISGKISVAKGLDLHTFTLVLGPIVGIGDTVPVKKDGSFTTDVTSPDAAALTLRAGANTVHTTLIYGLQTGTALVQLKVSTATDPPKHAYAHPYDVAATITLPDGMPDLTLHQHLCDQTGLAQTAPLRFTRFPDEPPTKTYMKAEQLAQLAKRLPIDEQRSVDVAYAVAVLSMLPVTEIDRDKEWVTPFLAALPRLLPPDDPAWLLCAYASWVLDAYADSVKGLAAYRDAVLQRHPFPNTRLFMTAVSAIEAGAANDTDRAEQLVGQMRREAPDHPYTRMTVDYSH